MKEFTDFRQEYADYRNDVKNMSYDELDNNETQNQRRLSGIVEGLVETCPKKANLEDHYVIFEGYRYLHRDNLTDNDRACWLYHTKAFVDKAEEGKNNEAMANILDSLPDMNPCPKTMFSCALKAWSKFSKDYHLRPHWKPMVEKSAETWLNCLMSDVRQCKDDKEKMKLCDEVSKVGLLIPEEKRISAHRANMLELEKVYNKSEWGRVEFPRKQRNCFNRVWKSLSFQMQNKIKNVNAYNYK